MPIPADDLAQIKAAVGSALDEARVKNPYHVPIQFQVGAIAFTLALTIAVVSALAGRDPAKVQPVMDAMLGGILGWLAIALCFQIVVATLLQIARFLGVPTTFWAGFLMLLSGLSGVPVLFLAVRGAAAIKAGTPLLPPLWDAIPALTSFW